MNADVKKVFMENFWFVATCDETPNVIPVGFKNVLDDGTMLIGDVMMVNTSANIKKNGKVAVGVCGPQGQAYQVKGTASYVAEGEIVDQMNKAAEAMGKPMRAKGVIVIKPECVIFQGAGPDNNHEIEW